MRKRGRFLRVAHIGVKETVGSSGHLNKTKKCDRDGQNQIKPNHMKQVLARFESIRQDECNRHIQEIRLNPVESNQNGGAIRVQDLKTTEYKSQKENNLDRCHAPQDRLVSPGIQDKPQVDGQKD